MATNNEIESGSSCKRFLMSGAIALVLVVVAFNVGAKGLGMLLVGVAIASFGLGAGSVMNTPEPMHKDIK